jgi:serine/threonine-protein kinase
VAKTRKTRIIDGRYELGPVIGRGGMATIHRATDRKLDRPVAVKLLRPEVTRDADLADRFRREALAATVLRHPNIVACLDTGTSGDQPYLVMDLIEGEDLAARLRRGGRLPAPRDAAHQLVWPAPWAWPASRNRPSRRQAGNICSPPTGGP